MQLGFSSLSGLAKLRDGVRRERVSSWDQKGGNYDWWEIAPHQSMTIGDIRGAGCVRHIWMTMWCAEAAFARKIVLRAWWDGEPEGVPEGVKDTKKKKDKRRRIKRKD